MSGPPEVPSPLVVAFVDDLLMTSKIENVARHLGYRVKFLGITGDSAVGDDGMLQNKPGEPISGPDAVLLENITRWQPALLVFDLGNDTIPWQRWIAIVKSSPATRRLPVLCFGPHVDVDSMTTARSLAADAVLARSRFVSSLPDLLAKYARVSDYQAVFDACQGSLSVLAERGLQAFNRGHYFESHELLEDAWNEDESAARELYRAILQIAVAYLQIERENYAGAVKMFLRVRQWMEPLPDVCKGVDVARLRSDAQNVYQALLELGSDGISEFDRSLFRPVQWAQGN